MFKKSQFNKKYGKKGYIFTMDAIIAMIILVAGLVVLLSTFSGAQPTQQTQFYSQDLINLYTKIAYEKIGDVNILAADAREISRLGAKTTIEILGELYYTDNMAKAIEIADDIARENLPPNYGLEIRIDDQILYHQDAPATNLGIGQAKTVTNNIVYVFGVVGNNADVWGPFKAEVKVWY